MNNDEEKQSKKKEIVSAAKLFNVL